jgi:YggT family protein
VDIICLVLRLFSYAVLVRLIMSWFPLRPGTPVASIYSAVFNITEPVLGPIRRVIPPVRMGVMAIDVSPILVFVGVALICR